MNRRKVMAKTAMSVTIDDKLIKQLKYLAGEDNRSLSNLAELILKSYVDVRLKESEIAQSYEKAKKIAADMRIASYPEAHAELMKNVSLTEADKQVLKALQGNR